MTFTPGSPSTPRKRPSVLAPISCSTRASGMPRVRAMRLAWMRAFACEMCGSTPEAEVVTASTGTLAFVSPGVNGPSSARYAAS